MYYNLNHQSYLIFMEPEFRPYLRTMDINKADWRIKIKGHACAMKYSQPNTCIPSYPAIDRPSHDTPRCTYMNTASLHKPSKAVYRNCTDYTLTKQRYNVYKLTTSSLQIHTDERPGKRPAYVSEVVCVHTFKITFGFKVQSNLL